MYVLLVERHDRRIAALIQAAATMRAAGADVDIPNPVFEREQFDADLVAEPVPDTPVLSLIRELGVA